MNSLTDINSTSPGCVELISLDLAVVFCETSLPPNGARLGASDFTLEPAVLVLIPLLIVFSLHKGLDRGCLATAFASGFLRTGFGVIPNVAAIND